jgi:pimeloyl-[acyl-carrier protein] synthase
VDVDLFDPEVRNDPFPLYRRLRALGQPVKDDALGFWMVATHAQVTQVLKDPGRFTSAGKADIGRVGEAFVRDSMGGADPPDHHRLRSVVQRAFTPRAVSDIADYAESLVKELLSTVEPGQPFDLVETLAEPLPSRVIAKMMGVPAARERDFRQWASDLVLGNSITASTQDAERADAAIASLRAYFSELIAERRLEPADDLIGRMVEANANSELAHHELLASCILLLFGGLETTTGLIANAALALIEHPEQRARLLAEPELMTPAIEELLRYAGPPQASLRSTTEDVELGGAHIPRGDHVLVLFGSANRDETVFPDEDQLLLDRAPNPHVAFALGPHFCLGAAVARLEVRAALRGLLDRAPDLELADPHQPASYRPGFFLRSLERLDLVFS